MISKLSVQSRSISACQRHHPGLLLHPNRIMQEHDLIYLVKGTWEIWQEDVCHTLSPGDMLLLHAGYHHYGVHRSSADCETMYVHFYAADGDVLFHTSAAPSPQSDFFLLPMCLHDGSGALYTLFTQLIDAYWSRDVYAQIRAESYLLLLLAQWTKMGFAAETQAEKTVIVHKLLTMMDSSEQHFFTVSQLASFSGVSVRTLQNYFHDVLGQSIHQYQIKTKLDKAHKLLSDPSLSLSAIAEKLGFCDEFHFSKQFKKRFGYAPRKMPPM